MGCELPVRVAKLGTTIATFDNKVQPTYLNPCRARVSRAWRQVATRSGPGLSCRWDPPPPQGAGLFLRRRACGPGPTGSDLLGRRTPPRVHGRVGLGGNDRLALGARSRTAVLAVLFADGLSVA
jgi:hypothetical protein